MKKLSTKKIFTIVGLVAGGLAVLFGVIMLFQIGSGLSRTTSTSFGSDFYTYSYQATATAASNVDTMINVASMGFGFLFIVFGLADISFFGRALFTENADAQVVTVEAPVQVPAAPKTAIEIAEEINKYKKLLDSNMITEEEFNARKAQILGL